MRDIARSRFALYASKLGNYYYEEIRHLLACGLRDQGFKALEADESRGFVSHAYWHVIVAPHEFFFLGAGRRLRTQAWPPGIILYNCEPLESPIFRFARRMLPRTFAIWEMDRRSAKRLTNEGWRSSWVPLGWTDSCDYFSRGRRSFEERPIDVLFLGSKSRRRDRIFASAQTSLSRYRTLFHLEEKECLRPDRARRQTQACLGAAQRAKIVLNIHREPFRYFQWHRMVLHGMAQGALVISEPTSDSSPFVPGRDFVAAPSNRIPAVVEHYLSSKMGRLEAARIARQGLETCLRSGRIARFLPRAIEELEQPESASAQRARIRADAAAKMLASARLD